VDGHTDSHCDCNGHAHAAADGHENANDDTHLLADSHENANDDTRLLANSHENANKETVHFPDSYKHPNGSLPPFGDGHKYPNGTIPFFANGHKSPQYTDLDAGSDFHSDADSDFHSDASDKNPSHQYTGNCGDQLSHEHCGNDKNRNRNTFAHTALGQGHDAVANRSLGFNTPGSNRHTPATDGNRNPDGLEPASRDANTDRLEPVSKDASSGCLPGGIADLPPS
jgi:hypothetical protein